MARPAELRNGTRPCCRAHRLSLRRSRKTLQRVRERIRIRRVVEDSFFAIAHKTRQTCDARRDDRKAGRHVLENFQGGPVEFVGQ